MVVLIEFYPCLPFWGVKVIVVSVMSELHFWIGRYLRVLIFLVCMAVVSEQGNTCSCPGIVPSRETTEMLQHRIVDLGVYAHWARSSNFAFVKLCPLVTVGFCDLNLRKVTALSIKNLPTFLFPSLFRNSLPGGVQNFCDCHMFHQVPVCCLMGGMKNSTTVDLATIKNKLASCL